MAYLNLSVAVVVVTKSVIITVDCINLAHGFFLKELSIFFIEAQTTTHDFFKPPPFLYLTANYRKTEAYTKKALGRLGVEEHAEGSLEYFTHTGVIDTLKNYRIYVMSDLTETFINKGVIPHAEIWDLQRTYNVVYPKQLPTAACGIHHNPRYCSMAKLWFLKAYIERNPPREWGGWTKL